MNHLNIYADICIIASEKGSEVSVGELLELYQSIPKSTLHRYLAQLVKYGWVKRAKRGFYYPQQNDVTEAIFKIVAMS